MGDLTKNLSRYEFVCKCGQCRMHSADHELVTVMQQAADYFAGVYNQRLAVVISSANRCEEHNRNEGGAEDSQHLYGIAADFYIVGVSASRLFDYLDEKSGGDRWGIGLYHNRVHLDMRDAPARWDNR